MTKKAFKKIKEGLKEAQTMACFRPGTFGCHEALDRTYVLMNLVGELGDHDAIRLNDKWRALAISASNTLWDLHQAIGAEHISAPTKKKSKRKGVKS